MVIDRTYLFAGGITMSILGCINSDATQVNIGFALLWIGISIQKG